MRRRQDLGARLTAQRAQDLGQAVPADSEGVVVDEQRPVAGNRLGDAAERLLPDQVLERQDPGVDLAVDVVAQLDRQREVPAGQEAGLGVDAHRLERGEGGVRHVGDEHVPRAAPACKTL